MIQKISLIIVGITISIVGSICLAGDTTIGFTILGSGDATTGPVDTGTTNTGSINTGVEIIGEVGYAGGDRSNRDGHIGDLGSAPDPQSNPDDALSVYRWAKQENIISSASFTEKNLNTKITRAELAKVITLFIKNMLGLSIAPDPLCKAKRYSDYAIMLEKDKPYIESACSAGILGLNSARTEIVATYNPYKYLTREQFVMVMSRLLYGDRYDNTPWEKSYKDRLATLMQAGFLKNPDGSLIETYVNVLTFLKRVAAAIPSLHVTQPKPVLSDGNDEMHVTYRRAKNNEITSIDTYTEAALYAPLTRQEMAKMLVMFSKNIVHKAPQENSICTIEQFTDYTGMTDSTQIYVKQACQLGLMGITSSGSLLTAFRPTDIVTRAELAAVLSRMLYGNTYDNIHNENEAWYVPHLQALSTAGYIKDITTPFMTERVGYVMIMMKRIAEKAYPSL